MVAYQFGDKPELELDELSFLQSYLVKLILIAYEIERSVNSIYQFCEEHFIFSISSDNGFL